MSAIKNSIFSNCTVEEKYINRENHKTEKKGCFPHCNASKSKKVNENFFDKGKKCDALWITLLGDTSSCARDKVCKDRNSTEKWMKLETHFSGASKRVAKNKNKENCAISLNDLNGSQNRSDLVGNQMQCHQKKSVNERRMKVKGHVIPGSASIAITPFLSSQNIIITYYLLFGKLKI